MLWVARYEESLHTAVRPEEPIPPPFVKNHPEVPSLECYEGEYSDEFWSKWPRVPLPKKANSPIIVNAYERHCKSSGVDSELLDRVVTNLREGAQLGARGAGRLPAQGKNLKNFYALGEKSLDAMCTWLHSDPPFMAGPFREHELRGGQFRSSPLQAQIKPNNRVRICVDQSWPHAPSWPPPDVFGSTPISVNSSIDKTLYPVRCVNITMYSLLQILSPG